MSVGDATDVAVAGSAEYTDKPAKRYAVMNAKSPYLIGPFVFAVSWLLYFGAAESAVGATQSGVASQETINTIQNEGRARVIVKLRTLRTYRKEMGLSRTAARQQRVDIAAVQRRVRNHLRGTSHVIRREFKTVPYIAVEIDAEGLAKLEAADLDVESIYEDRLAKPFLAESIPQIEGDLALQAGLDGTGSVVVVADTGVDKDHPFLAGKVIEEACYAMSENGIDGDCPNGQATQVTDGAGVPCTFDPTTCRHGTHVAGIVAGSGSNFSGVAPGANLIAIQVFHSSLNCGFFEATPCARAFGSDIVAALERVYELRDQYPIASVNLSIGAGASNSTCDADFPEFLAVMDNLKATGIATVVASGNGAYSNAISWPACVSTAVSVAAVDENDLVASFSNVSQDLDLFAPGTAIDSSIPGGDFATFSGTSMSTPHVAGAWAVLEQAFPAATVDDNLTLLETTGRPVTDVRGSLNITKPRIRLAGAAGIEYPLPILTSIAPTSVSAWGPETTLTVTGFDFSRSSVVFVDGIAAPTAYVSDTVLTTTLTTNGLATSVTSLDINVFSPPPGGGLSNSIPLIVTYPTLTVSSSSAAAGEPITVTLNDGPGNSYDWLALAAVGDPDTSYLTWIYVSPGATTATWTVTMPGTPGDYEFRVFENGGFTRMATSPTVTVGAAPPEPEPPPDPTPTPAVLDVSTTAVNGGDAVTVTLSDGPGNIFDWLALAGVGDPDTTYLQWTYVSSGATTATWTVTMPATPGDYEFRLFDNGGYARIGTSPTVTVGAAPPEPEPPPDPTPTPAVLDVSTTAVNGGDAVTVTLSDGPGNSFDWLALAGVGDPDTTYLTWIYVSPGATTATWTVTMPATPGDYEFRLFDNGGYTRIGTSPTVTVGAAPPEPEPPPDPTPIPAVLDVSTTAVNGGDAVTVTLSDGPGNSYDWLALAGVGDPDTTYLTWIYVSPGATTATWTVTMPATPGDYEFRLFDNGGYTRIGTSPTVTVGAAPPEPEPPPDPTPIPAVLDVSTTAVNGGDAVTVTLSDGPGNSFDWVALAGVGDPDTTYLQWTYVSSGATTATWTVTMPATPGDYEFRLFENGGYTRIATSPTVVVGP